MILVVYKKPANAAWKYYSVLWKSFNLHIIKHFASWPIKIDGSTIATVRTFTENNKNYIATPRQRPYFVYCLLFTVYCLLFIVCCLFLIIYLYQILHLRPKASYLVLWTLKPSCLRFHRHSFKAKNLNLQILKIYKYKNTLSRTLINSPL